MIRKNLSFIIISLICAVALGAPGPQAGYRVYTTGWGDEIYVEEPEDKSTLTRERVEDFLNFESRLEFDQSQPNRGAVIFVDDGNLKILQERGIVDDTWKWLGSLTADELPLDLPVEVRKAGLTFQQARNIVLENELTIQVVQKSELKAFLEKHKVLDESGAFLGDPGVIEISEDMTPKEIICANALNDRREQSRKSYREMPRTQGYVVRRVIYEILEASLNSTPDQVPNKMRSVLARYGQFWEILSENPSIPELIETAGLPGKDSQNIATALIEEILSEPVISANLKAFAGRRPLQQKNLSENKQVERRRFALNLVPDSIFQNLALNIRERVDQLDISGHEAIESITQVQGPKETNELTEIMQITLKKYFASMSFEDKSRLALAYTKLEPDASLETQIAAALQATGPFLQKLFQLIGDEVDSELLRRATRELKASVSPFPGAVARQIIEESLGHKIDEVFSEFNDIPINAGTIGQIHLARLKSNNMPVVVKVLRPGVSDHFQRELKIIYSLVQTPSLRKIVETYAATITAEMDFRTEGENTDKASFMNRAQKGVFAVSRIPEVVPTHDVLVLARAEGRPLDKYPLFQAVPDANELRQLSQDEIEIMTSRFSEIMKIWFSNALFGTGEFHGDIHTGNMMLSLSDKAPATVIDFGNFQKLSISQRQDFIRLVVASYKSRSKKAAEVVGRLGGFDQDQVDALKKKLDEGHWENLSLTDKMSSALAYGGKMGARLPPEFLNFARSKLMLETAASVVNRNLESIDPQGVTYTRLNPNKIFSAAAIGHVLDGISFRFRNQPNLEPILTRKFISEILSDLARPSETNRCFKLFKRKAEKQI